MKLANRIKIPDEAILAAAVITALLIIFILCYNGSAGVPCSGPGVITVYGNREYYESEDLTVDIYCPMILGFPDKDFENRLNVKIKNQISLNRHVAEMQTARWKPYVNEHELPYYFESGYWIKSSDGILSLKVTTHFWHYNTGMPLTSYYNADIADNKLLTLGDLFIDSSYKEKINAIIAAAIATEDPWRSNDVIKSVSDKTKFFIMDGSLYIAFSKYEITSGSGGEPEFLIPTKEIEDLLKEKYKGIFK